MRAEIYRALERRLAEERPAVLATVIAGFGVGNQLLLDLEAGGGLSAPGLGTLGTPERDRAVRAPARAALDRLASASCTLRDEADGEASGATGETEIEVFLDVHPPRRTLFAIGAVHVAIPLIVFARTLGMRTVVIDPRSAFATRARFPDADVVDTGWPDEALARHGLGLGSHVAALSHDLKIDVPALAAALRSPARYIGALGSRKTHAKRVAALRELGFEDDALARIHNPIGLPLGGRRAEEIAVSIIAEMVAVGHGRASAAVRDG